MLTLSGPRAPAGFSVPVQQQGRASVMSHVTTCLLAHMLLVQLVEHAHLGHVWYVQSHGRSWPEDCQRSSAISRTL